MGVCIRMDPGDNVATVLQQTAPGDVLDVLDRQNNRVGSVASRAEIPFAHKICLGAVEKGGNVMKFDAPIGRAAADIAVGDYVHVHNVHSLAGAPKGGGGT